MLPLWLVVALSVGLWSCGTAYSESVVRVRVSNGLTACPSASVVLKSGNVTLSPDGWSNVPFAEATSYASAFASAFYEAVVTCNVNRSEPILVDLTGGLFYTLQLADPASWNGTFVALLTIVDDVTAPADLATACVKIVQAVPGSVVDVYVDGHLLQAALPFGEASVRAVVPAGQHTWSLAVAGGRNYTLNSTLTTCPAGGVWTIFISGSPLTAAVFSAVDVVYASFTLRVANLHPAPPGAVIVSIDNGVRQDTLYLLAYGQVSSYASLVVPLSPVGSLSVADSADPTRLVVSVPLVDPLPSVSTLALLPSQSYEMYSDLLAPPASAAAARLRLVNGVAGTSSVDLWADGLAVFAGVAYSESTPYVDVPAHTYALRLFSAAGNQSSPLLELPNSGCEAGSLYTVFATDASLVLVEDLSYTFATVSFVHALSDAGAVNVTINGQPTFSSVPFAGLAPFVDVAFDSPAAMQNVSVIVSSSASGLIVLNGSATLAAGGNRSTLVLTGLAAQSTVELVVYDDPPLPSLPVPAAGSVLVRFADLMPTTTAVTVVAAPPNSSVVNGLGYTGLSDWLHLPVGDGQTQLAFYNGSSDTPVLSYAVQFSSGSAYTIFAEGFQTTHASLMVTPLPALATVRVINTASSLPALDVVINGLLQGSHVGFQQTAEFNVGDNATVAMDFVATGSIRPLLAWITMLRMGTANVSVVVFDAPTNGGTASAVQLSGIAGVPPSGETQVRFVHSISAVPAMQIFINGYLIVPELSFATGSVYQTLPGGTHSLLLESMDGTPVLQQTLYLSGGAAYTVLCEQQQQQSQMTGGPRLLVQKLLDAGVEQPEPSTSSGSSTGGAAATATTSATTAPDATENATSGASSAPLGTSSGPAPVVSTTSVTSGPAATSDAPAATTRERSSSGPADGTSGRFEATTAGNWSLPVTTGNWTVTNSSNATSSSHATTTTTTTTTTTGGDHNNSNSPASNTVTIALVSTGCALAFIVLGVIGFWAYRRHRNRDYDYMAL